MNQMKSQSNQTEGRRPRMSHGVTNSYWSICWMYLYLHLMHTIMWKQSEIEQQNIAKWTI